MENTKQLWRKRKSLSMQGKGRLLCTGPHPSQIPLLSLFQLQLPCKGSPPPLLFLPTDPPMAWLLAKCWVRSSDFQLHELQSHLLRGHLMAEVIAVATMRCLPSIHPMFKVTLYPPLLPRSLPPRVVPPLEAPPLWNLSFWEEATNKRQMNNGARAWLALHF